MRIAWLANYPAPLLEPALKVTRHVAVFHPSSWIVNLSQALAENEDLELHLVTENHLISKDQVVKLGRITFHVLKNGVPFTNRCFPPWLPLDVLTGFKWNVHRLVKEIERINPDLVHAHGTEAAYALAALKSGYPSIISIQGVITEYARLYPSFRDMRVARLEQRAVLQGKYFIAQSQFVHEFLKNLNPNAEIFDLELAMHPAYFDVCRGENVEHRIVFVGVLSERKGLSELLTSFKDLLTDHPGYRLVIVGRGNRNYEESVNELAVRLGISESIEWAGFQRADQIAKTFETAEMLVVPSKAETFCCVVAEGMIAGIPIIGSKVGGISSLLTHRETGLLVDPGNPKALADAMREIADNPEFARKIGEKAKQVGRRRFSGAMLAQQHIELYHEILCRR